MNKITRVKSKDFTTISNVFLRSNNLSLKAKGLLATVLSLPEDWDFSINGICAIVKEGKTAVYSAIDELKENGYCVVEVSRNEKGCIKGTDYTFIENPYTENLDTDNQPQINTELIKEEKKEKTIDKKKDLFEDCWKAYNRKGSKKDAYEQWCKLKDDDFDKVVKHIPFYIKSNEHVFLKDFERYLRHRTFESVVFDKQTGQITYDPERENGESGYTPQCGGALVWNDYYKCYMYTGYWSGRIADGYTDDNRPDGAEITLNNGRGEMVWSRETKTWNRK